ncbi:hypothetical protein ROA7450_01798 [Roseovarius albus]|uniref:Uncharacterized protein n=1 Tax=Roseovarius albus TaxID=1247867 RepID=A0A1X6Z1Y1_9RHOB|nr:hypothetical protein ROA7450_01798 [Roseovarius albus]
MPPFSFAVQALSVNRPVFFCLRPERRPDQAHLIRVSGGADNNFPPLFRDQLQPLVAPQVLHFMQVPLRTRV